MEGRENLWGGRRRGAEYGGAREEGDWREGQGAAEGFPPNLEGRRHPAARRRPRRALPLCPLERGFQIGRETARRWARATAAGGEPGVPWVHIERGALAVLPTPPGG